MKGKPFSPEIKAQVIADYKSGRDPVWYICQHYGVSWRTLHEWVEGCGQDRRHTRRPDRRSIRLTKDDAELLLLCIVESESIAPREYMPALRRLEDRLCDIADELTLTTSGS